MNSESSSEDSDRGIVEDGFEKDEVSHPLVFMDQTCQAEFTFRAPLIQYTNVTKGGQAEKRQKGHPDGPTPAPSPAKKRMRQEFSLEPLDPLNLPTSPGPEVIAGTAVQDVFGYNSENQPEVSLESGGGSGSTLRDAECSDYRSGSGSQIGRSAVMADLKAYWKEETAEEKEARHIRGWEELRRDHEKRESRALEDAVRRRAKIRSDDRERAQRYRDRKREERIERGWIPGQKRVSFKAMAIISHLQ